VNRKMIVSGLAAGALAVTALSAAMTGASAMPAAQQGLHTVRACSSAVQPGFASCLALGVARGDGTLVVGAKPLAAAFTPAEIQKAYGLTGLSAGGRTAAIVDAFGYPGLEADLAVYRSTNGLPPCTTANGCFKRMDQNGGSSNPPTNPGWDIEQALDVDAVSAACPDCKILVVQANDNSFNNLGIAVNRAAMQPGVAAISNSYGGSGSQSSAYNHPGIAVVASTGDNGFQGGQYPADDTNVVAVGGTSAVRDGSSRGVHESVWAGTGSGCGSKAKPKWQNKAGTTCSGKAMSDVSAVADPGNGGISVYCGSVSGCGGFAQYGGTSLASPIIGAVYTLSGKTSGYPAKFAYKPANKAFLNDITSGSNGSCGVPLCTARVGWDGPTGMGTPLGVGAF
jgi:subtilase family serine protease